MLTLIVLGGSHRAILEGFSSSLHRAIATEDASPSADDSPLLSMDPVSWIGKTIRVGEIRTSDVRAVVELTTDGWRDVRAAQSLSQETKPDRRVTSPSQGMRTLEGGDGSAFSAAATIRDHQNNLEWQLQVTPGLDFSAARKLAPALNLDGGGWRLPTSAELETLPRAVWPPNAPWVWTAKSSPIDLDFAVAHWPPTLEAREWLRSNRFAVRYVRSLDT